MLYFIFDKPVKKLLILTPISSPLVSAFYIPLELVFVFEPEEKLLKRMYISCFQR